MTRAVFAVAALSALACLAGYGNALAAPSLPEIRTSAANPVPRCVTPDRLMAFLQRRNGNLDPRFRDIARHYQHHGEAWHVRWDYAFFQMAIETNFLTYRAPSGRMGDVDPKQNNFAGIGTTGGGVPGDSFPDVSTGVLGQIQHLVAYSGEMVPRPVAPRTQLKQEHILAKSRELNRPVRFSDLARRWAVDPKYANSIEWVAERYRREECAGREAPQKIEVLPWQQPQRGREGPRAEADPKAPVRTIWRRDDQKTSAAAVAQAAPAQKAASPEAGPRRPDEPTAKAPDIVSVTAEAVAVPPPDAPRLAMFTPPAALAGAAMPQPAPERPRSVVAPKSAQVPTAQGPAAASEPPAMGPPAPPPGGVAVAPLVEAEEVVAESKPSFAPPSGLGVKPGRCVVETATFGGETTVLVKSPAGADTHYIALSVIEGFEESMTQSFLAARPAGSEALGTFTTRDAALAQARTLCPE
jgi:hypothetical protein